LARFGRVLGLLGEKCGSRRRGLKSNVYFWTAFWSGLGGFWARLGSKNGEQRREKRKEKRKTRKENK
jgi:hypothetical protein